MTQKETSISMLQTFQTAYWLREIKRGAQGYRTRARFYDVQSVQATENGEASYDSNLGWRG